MGFQNRSLLLFFLIFLCIELNFAQSSRIISQDTTSVEYQTLRRYEDTLKMLSETMLHDSVEAYRFFACREMVTMFAKALKVHQSFYYKFDSIKAVSIMYPEDSAFRILTWQLYINQREYKYYGAIQLRADELRLIPLADRSADLRSPDYKTLSPENWYGALYYRVQQVDRPAGRYYLLYGFDAFDFFTRRKVVDVLTLDNEKVKFGLPVFVKKPTNGGLEDVKHRFIVEYSAEAAVGLNYSDEYEMILFDHLIPMGGSYNQGMTMVPDGSYNGYKIGNDGRWYFVDKVFNDFQESAPRPSPVLDNRKGDIFGVEKPPKTRLKKAEKQKN